MSDSPEPVAPLPAASSSQLTPAAVHAAGDQYPLIAPVDVPSSPLVRFGGLLGIIGSSIGLLALLVGCAGYSRALAVSPGPVALGGLGIVLTLAGAFLQRRRLGEDTHVLQALFACLMSVVGGLVEMAVWRGWSLFK